MRRLAIIAVTAIALVAIRAEFATSSDPIDLSGRWSGRTLTGVKIVLELRSDGSALHGTLTRNRTSPITYGHISDRGFTFQALLGRRNERFTGWFVGNDRIRLSIDGGMGFLTRVTFRRIESQD